MHTAWKIFLVLLFLAGSYFGLAYFLKWPPFHLGKSPSGPGGKAGSSCKTNSDCGDDTPICKGGKCTLIKCGDGCDVNADCSRTNNCFYCVSGKCVTESEVCGNCKVDADCQPSCPHCVTGVCKSSLPPPPASCPSNPIPNGVYALFTKGTGSHKILSFNPNLNTVTFESPNASGYHQYVKISNGVISFTTAALGDFIYLTFSGNQLGLSSDKSSAEKWMIDKCGVISSSNNQYVLSSTSGDDLRVITKEKDVWKNNNNVFLHSSPPTPPGCGNPYTQPVHGPYYILSKHLGTNDVYTLNILGPNTGFEKYPAYSGFISHFLIEDVDKNEGTFRIYGLYSTTGTDCVNFKVYLARYGGSTISPIPEYHTGTGPSCKSMGSDDYPIDSTFLWKYDECGLLTDPDKKVMASWSVDASDDDDGLGGLTIVPYSQYGWQNDKNIVEFSTAS